MTSGTATVVNHQHCYVCDRAMPVGETKSCSPACQAKLDEQNKKRRQLQLFLYAAMALTLLLLLFGATRGG